MKILFLAANPEGTTELELRKEANKIHKSLQKAGVADKFQLVEKWAVDSEALRGALLDEQPDIVHFSGHGTGVEGLMLQGQDGIPRPATGDALANLFKIVNSIKPMRCVLLNACYAEEQAKAIFQHIDNVIGMKREVKDDAAIAFATGFYDGLGRKHPVQIAFDLGCVAIQFETASFSQKFRKAVVVLDEAEKALEPIPDHLIPVLFSREVIDSTMQKEPLSEALTESGISKDEALGQYREDVKRCLEDRVLTPTEAFQLSTRATALKLTEAEANRILEEEQQRLTIQTQSFSFKVPTVTVEKGLVPFMAANIKIGDRNGKAEYFVEKLDGNTGLEMVKIKGGNFTMGSPSSEKDRSDDEGPQHLVRIQPFFMGRYAVTQEQWFTVAQDFPKVKIDLNPDPSRFKGSNRPVEQVNWWEAIEFCDRLSEKTGKQYRLPSEAEWEYACRAGTTTPFYCGETITTDLANYDGNYTYGSGTKGVYQEQTIDVGSFPPNGFGLYDMHGNVLEWCADHLHKNYQGAPIDGSAWIKGGDSDRRLLRGGSWGNNPRYCRSAYRFGDVPVYRSNRLGFRVVYSAAWTPS